MQIDTEHLHFWMQAIRQSPDPMRTMDAFWSGQLKSKEWLIDNLKKTYAWNVDRPATISIHGGWVGTLASMLFQSNLPIKYIESIDLDPTCESIATMINKLEEQDGKFKAITADMCSVPLLSNIVINTSCEHITQEQYDQWLAGVPDDTLIVLQSNNYKIPEHIRTTNTMAEFWDQSHIKVIHQGTLELPMYNRWMIIGYKHV
jgi:hypothetical protein